jgi:hypothetical protein
MDMSQISDEEKGQWVDFFNTAVSSKPRISVAVAAVCQVYKFWFWMRLTVS